MEKPERIGTYRIDAELSHGSITTVYKGFDETLGRPVLIKKLHSQMAREDDIRNRFEREAQVCARVKHENIVDIFNYQSDPELTLLVLEYIEGNTLGDLSHIHSPIDWKIVLAILYNVLKGLTYAHSKSVIHRDLKPDNILISKEGKVKISDFGLATMEFVPKLTRQGMVVGTPAYMPPEQVTGGKIDQRSDLFSLGATFYELLTGVSPFQGKSFSETMKNILEADIKPPSELIDDIPREFDQIILRLLEKQPSKRYTAADHVLEDVRNLCVQKNVPPDAEYLQHYFFDSDSGTTKPVKRVPSTSSIKVRRDTKALPGWIFPLIFLILAVASFIIPQQLSITDYNPPRISSNLIDSITTTDNPGQTAIKHEINSNDSDINRSATKQKTSPPEELDVTPQNRASGAPVTNKPISNSSDDGTNKTGDNKSGISSEPGHLLITAKPWAIISIDNVAYGQTPIKDPIELIPGEYRIVLANDQFPTPVTESVVIQPGKETRLDVDLWEYFAVVNIRQVKPWAEIFVDDQSYGMTPYAKPIILTFGEHLIELRNPDFQTWSRKFVFERNDPATDIKVELTPKGEVSRK